MAELSLWLDYYDDIYSDFDSRHYQKRRISDDFLYELRNALKYRQERMNDLVLLLPGDKRDEETEKTIINGLHAFFSKQFRIHSDKCRHKLQRGIMLGFAGIMIMVLNSLIVFKSIHSFPLVALQIILEPAGWFLLWASLDFLLYDRKELKKEKEFYKEMAALIIHFRTA